MLQVQHFRNKIYIWMSLTLYKMKSRVFDFGDKYIKSASLNATIRDPVQVPLKV